MNTWCQCQFLVFPSGMMETLRLQVKHIELSRSDLSFRRKAESRMLMLWILDAVSSPA